MTFSSDMTKIKSSCIPCVLPFNFGNRRKFKAFWPLRQSPLKEQTLYLAHANLCLHAIDMRGIKTGENPTLYGRWMTQGFPSTPQTPLVITAAWSPWRGGHVLVKGSLPGWFRIPWCEFRPFTWCCHLRPESISRVSSSKPPKMLMIFP